MENQLVPNIDKIHEEIDSANWEKILLAVGRFVEGVKAELGGNGFGYLQCLKSLSISFDDIPEQTTGAEELAWVTADMILGRFNYEKFRLTVVLLVKLIFTALITLCTLVCFCRSFLCF